MTEALHLESPAKVNLRLEVLNKRKDGYHEVSLISQKISLHDTLHFSLEKEGGISVETDQPKLATGKSNLVYQAAQSILERSDYKEGVHIKIEKRIPLGAGLGGGSSNAATTLRALNELLRLNLSKKELMEIGLRIGADVPYFFMEGAAVATGIGEKLKKIELPPLWYVLLYPNFEVSTKWAYQNFVLTKNRFRLKLHTFPRTPRGISRILRNDLEEVVSKKYPQIDVMKKFLSSSGAINVLMTGSGPTVYGIFPEERDAMGAYEKVAKLIRRKSWVIFKAHSIP